MNPMIGFLLSRGPEFRRKFDQAVHTATGRIELDYDRVDA